LLLLLLLVVGAVLVVFLRRWRKICTTSQWEARWERWSQFGHYGWVVRHLAGVPIVDEERNGGAQVGEEEVQRELVVPTQPARERAQVEDEEAQGDDHALPHLGTWGSCLRISRQIRKCVATTGI
jgi:hypothetical protein